MAYCYIPMICLLWIMGIIVYESGFYNIVQVLFSQGICRVAVPMFYFISGYLFYNELKEWNWEVYGRKLKSRVSTILIPYCIWNIIGWFLLCLNHSFFKGGFFHLDEYDSMGYFVE